MAPAPVLAKARLAPRLAPARYRAPGLTYEREAWADGHDVVVGIDEVGRGAWAGPLMVGAAVLPQGRRVYGVRDSKALAEVRREVLFDRVAAWCRAWAVGAATQVECDSLGMAEAQRLATRRAVEGLGLTPDAVLIDGGWDFAGLPNTLRIVRGDACCLSIAAASVLAKVTRDRYMRSVAPNYPPYAFQDNKGYPCWRHKMALQAYGPCAIHRRTWVFMDALTWGMRARRADGSLEDSPGLDEGYDVGRAEDGGPGGAETGLLDVVDVLASWAPGERH
jgi:ribonuclease HII